MSAEGHDPERAQDAGRPGESEALRMGVRVLASDGECGELVRVIVDPVAQRVTHLVVGRKHVEGAGRLVPMEMVETADAAAIRLRMTVEHFHELDDAQDVQFLPANTDSRGYGSSASAWPHYGLATPASGAPHEPMYMDRVPVGEVEVLRGDEVHATDGWVGSVQGLVVDPRDHHVTHVLLKEGHLWGRRQVAIPIGAASRVENEIRVGLTKREIEDLPPVELETAP